MRIVAKWLVWTGAAGTLLLIAIGTVRTIAASGLPPGRLFAAGVVMVLWMLSPYYGALHQQAKALPNRGDGRILLLGAVLVVGYGGYAYLSEFVILPMFYGVRPRTGSAILVLIVPLFQWVGIGITGGLRWVVKRAVAT